MQTRDHTLVCWSMNFAWPPEAGHRWAKSVCSKAYLGIRKQSINPLSVCRSRQAQQPPSLPSPAPPSPNTRAMDRGTQRHAAGLLKRTKKYTSKMFFRKNNLGGRRRFGERSSTPVDHGWMTKLYDIPFNGHKEVNGQKCATMLHVAHPHTAHPLPSPPHNR